MRSRSRNRNYRRFVIAIVLFLVVSVGILFSSSLFKILSAFFVSFSVETPAEYELLPKNILASRLHDAELELTHVRYQAALYAELIEENARLIKELELPTENEVGIGRVVGTPPQTHYDTLLVSLQDDHSVAVGDIALFDGFVLGSVSEIGSRAALVTLYSSPGTTLDVRVGDPSAIVVAHGLGGGSFVFDTPNEVDFAVGDTVLRAANETHVVGVVRSITGDPDKTSKRVHAQTVIAFPDIRFVRFVRPTGESL